MFKNLHLQLAYLCITLNGGLLLDIRLSACLENGFCLAPCH